MSQPGPSSTASTDAIVLRTAFRNYSAAERGGVLVFGLILPPILIAAGVYFAFTMGTHVNDFAYILPILGVVMMGVILTDHAAQTIRLHPAGIETKRLWKRQRADARDIVFVLGMHRKNRHAIMLVKRDSTGLAFGPGLSVEDYGRARRWATELAQSWGSHDEGDRDISSGAEARSVMLSLLAKYNTTGRSGTRRNR